MKELDMNVNLRLYGRVTNLIINHKKSRNEAVSYYKCDLCKYKTTQHSNVNVHKKSKYEGVRNGCDKCEYKAT